jgi:putative phage-type endonuclease
MTNNSDSEYVQETDTDPDSISISNAEISSTADESIDESIDESLPLENDDITELTIDIFDLLDEYHTTHILEISSPNYYKNAIENTANILINEWIDADICDDDDFDDVYDELTELIESVLEIFIEKSGFIQRSTKYTMDNINIPSSIDIPALTTKIQELQNIPQPQQKTKEWHEYRYNLITASNLWKALGSEAQMNSLIYEKCKPLNLNGTDYNYTNTDSALHWGVKYEPVTVMVYEHMFQTRVGEFGCIKHSKYPFIGASPDGINIDPQNQRYGRMLEIKNIVNREITGIPKEEYWIQTQIQMETCELDECDFVETRFLEYPDETAFYNDETHEYKGVILNFIERTTNSVTKNTNPVYHYMPVDVSSDRDTIMNWIQIKKDELRKKGMVLYSTIYWYMDQFSCVLIQRNKSWFELAVPKIESVWQTIEKERVDGYEHRSSKKRIPKVNVVLSSDSSNSYMINNLVLTNSICLVKLDS